MREIVTPIWFDYRGTHFFDGDGKMIAQIRGWGGLTSSGLTDEEARAIQEKNAGYIVNAVNEYEVLTAKIEALEARLAAAKNDLNQLSSRSWLKSMTRAEFAKRSLANLQKENTDA